jgi:hypothetical protein
VRLNGLARDLLTGREHDEVLTLDPLDAVVLEEAD